ncbi:NUDIX domain-containing protein [Dehalococcoides mccartyi]|uniref:NUDIX domain-containing protein n=1 Tax=Dehalococcoides mccartyi TaxID=61435 RepID=UPI00107E740D|nr:NUDIX domain-containing protein [Dehalococcoides mccartyi]QBX63342.1 NUDIX domain-containing protein [Dehalococcoides mccartyi]
MSKVSRRRRGTAIVETPEGILVTAGGSKVYLLPGGGANKHETRMQAAMRELKEETGLEPYSVKYLFHHRGKVHKSHGHGYFRDDHTVCLVKAKGIPSPHHEIKYIAFYTPGSGVHISGVTHEIVERYYRYKKYRGLRQRQISLFSRFLEWFR